ncbi:hypothetical protein LSH36_155g04091 [Paralvinella palmiformis]|uniref:Ig-like domain-containing protein n=1 Tax=Paralvinella palmiformis TaxID=53620 RepID=A0AAD9JUF5_9ANNE|nr:hypothetical protein LSH36_155g04091 [Paralvinella palmiformis]
MSVLFWLLATHFILSSNGLSRNVGLPIGEDYHLSPGSSRILNCSQSGSPPVDTWVNVTWILPNLSLIQRGRNHTLADDTMFVLSDDGELLIFENLQPKWYGDYYCVVLHREPNFYVKKFGLNSSFYYAAELHRQYERTILILAVASGSLLALITLIFSVVVWCRKTRLYHRSNKLSVKLFNILFTCLVPGIQVLLKTKH